MYNKFMRYQNKKVILKKRPDGFPKIDDFELVENIIDNIEHGEIIIEVIWLSLDPYMRGRMNPEKSYADPIPLNGIMEGGTVSIVEKSNGGKFSEGEFLVGRLGWQTHAVSNGVSLSRIQPVGMPISTALGVLGMPGMTAYSGLLKLGKPKEGETLVVAAASGAVGANVGQIAKIKG